MRDGGVWKMETLDSGMLGMMGMNGWMEMEMRERTRRGVTKGTERMTDLINGKQKR